ncbi:VOC family protein [Bacillus suaedaesalsae]|uniref:VOC family protein n=1 Tax=Bacillus suaedaesalsae TaxID=2810349 RepID=A0ABS2DD93_9BACI|nr:VOC family protein [Bacillus suaedaesalsae]MBM6616427.1 VOC family protein [Bacillus suaedaesalsae]
MSELFKRIDTVFLKVIDFDKAIDWYCTVLDFTLRWKDEKGGYAALNIGETPLTLVRSSDKAKGTNVTFNFFSPDIEAVHHHLRKHDVQVEPIHDEAGVKWFAFDDLEGNPLAVCSFKE